MRHVIITAQTLPLPSLVTSLSRTAMSIIMGSYKKNQPTNQKKKKKHCLEKAAVNPRAEPRRYQSLRNPNTPVWKWGQPQSCSKKKNLEDRRSPAQRLQVGQSGKSSDLLLFLSSSFTNAYNYKNDDLFKVISTHKGCIPLVTAPFLFCQYSRALWLRS